MFKFSTKPKQSVLGLDITPAAVKLLELSQQNGQYSVENYVKIPLPYHAIVEHDIQDKAAISGAIREAYRQSQTTLNQVAIAIPDAKVITHIVQVDAQLKGLALEVQVQSILSRFLPFAIEDAAIDFELREISLADSQKREVLIVAARAQEVVTIAEIILAAGLMPCIVDIESFSIARACGLLASKLPNGGINKIIAVFHVRPQGIALQVLKDMKVIYRGEESQSEVEKARIADSQGPTEVIQQMMKALQYFFMSSHYRTVDYIVLGGDDTMLPILSSALHDVLPIENMMANPFVNTEIAKKIPLPLLIEDAPSLMVCAGLAKRGSM